MIVTFDVKTEGNIIEVHATGKLSVQDYERFIPEVERVIAENKRVRLLFVMEDFHGWKAGALWEDIKFDWKHFSDFEKLAFVGDQKWEKGMSSFCKPFTIARIRYFTPDQIDQAREWLRK